MSLTKKLEQAKKWQREEKQKSLGAKFFEQGSLENWDWWIRCQTDSEENPLALKTQEELWRREFPLIGFRQTLNIGWKHISRTRIAH